MKSAQVRSAFWLIFEKGLRVASGILVTAAVARHLGPNNYGALATALGTVAIFSAGASMGADHINTAELSKLNKSASIKFLSSAILARLLWSLTCFFTFLLFIFFTDKIDNAIYVIIATAIPIAAFSIIGNKIQADGEFDRYALLSCAVLIFGAAIKIFGIYQQNQITYFAAAAILDAAMSTALYFWWVFRKNNFTAIEVMPKWSASQAYIRLCIPTAISAVLVALYLRLELFMVNSLIDNKAAGLWAGVVMFISPWGMVAASILTVANRHLSKLGVDDLGYEDSMVRLIRFMLFLSIIAIFINLAITITIIPILLGEQYLAIRYVVWIASATLIPIFMGSVQEIWIAHQGKTSIVLKKVIIGLPISMAFSYFFINNYGLHGVALGMVSSYFTTAIIMNYFFDRRFLILQLSAIGFDLAR